MGQEPDVRDVSVFTFDERHGHPLAAPQAFANHRSIDRAFILEGVLGFIAVVLAGTDLAMNGLSLVTGAVALMGLVLIRTMLRMRAYSVTLQDRIVRIEMRLRLERLLPADLQARIPEFTRAQLIGLRFASDAELPELARTVLENKVVNADAIKQLVKNWQPDSLRV